MKSKEIDFQKMTVYEGPKDSPGYLLWTVFMQWRTAIEAVLKPLDLTHPQFVVLVTTGWLTKKGEVTTQAAVARQAELDPNTTSQVIRGLEAKGFVRRVRKIDERSKNPELTELGKKRLQKALPAVENADNLFFKNLNKKELFSFVRSFQKLLQ